MTAKLMRRTATAEAAGDPDEKVYRVAKIAAVVAGLHTEGVSPREALAGVALTADEMASSQTRVSLNQTIACCRNAIKLSRDRMFAFRTGLGFHVSTQGMYGFAILSSTDYRKAIDFAIAYHRLATPLATIEFREEKGRGLWSVRPVSFPGVDAAMYRFLAEMQFGIHTALHRDVMGADFAPQEIHLTYGTAADAANWRAGFGCDVRCSQPENRLVFDAKWLDAVPLLGHDIAHADVAALVRRVAGRLAVPRRHHRQSERNDTRPAGGALEHCRCRATPAHVAAHVAAAAEIRGRIVPAIVWRGSRQHRVRLSPQHRFADRRYRGRAWFRR